MKKRLFSGAQPTGTLHIGNYIGAIKNWVKLMDNYDCIFSIVDLHGLTIEYDVKDYRNKILDLAKTYIACGIDPEKCTIFVQSAVKEHTELMWLLSTVTPMGELNRMTQFKDKSQNNQGNINLGLYGYPVLQTADILIYKADAVPVGEDQIQHIELAREIVRKFNTRFNTDFFPEPQEILTKGARLLGTDGENKMSKSKHNIIGLDFDKKMIQKALMGAKTDPARMKKTDPGNPDICNIYSWHKIFSTEEELEFCSNGCKTAEIGCVQCKKILLENLNNIIEPIREKKLELDKQDSYILDVLNEGGKRCQKIARENMENIREIMGLKL